MTDYNPFLPEELLPGAAGTSFHFYRWANNHIASLEGAPGAPRLYRDALRSFLAGPVVFYDNISGGTNTTATWAEVARFNFVQVGGVRIVFQHAPALDGQPVDARVVLYRGGGATVLQSWTTTALADRLIELWVLHGDLVTVEHRSNPAYLGPSYINNIRYGNDGNPVWDTIGGRVKF